MSVQWTEEQSRAIDARGGNLLLSAAAGSGKTTVLVARVMKLLEEGASIDRMLVVTFTNAAASDMRAKLSKKLAEAASQNARLRDQMIALEHASITTLHAFCADFLRTNFERAGVDPAFRILDDSLSRPLMDAAMDEVLEEAYANIDADPALQQLDYGRGVKNVRVLVEQLSAVLQERPDPQEWLESVTNPEIMIPEWLGEVKNGAKRAIANAIVDAREALNTPNCPEKY